MPDPLLKKLFGTPWYPPILAYHRIHPQQGSDTPTLTPEVFERQMAMLASRWEPIPLSQLIHGIEGKVPLTRRAVVVTFDDGEDSIFLYAFPVLRKYRIPAVVFMIAGNIDKPGSLTGDQIRQMAKAGVSFGSHTMNHAYLPSLPIEKALQELRDSRESLMNLGLSVEFLSYPGGGFTPLIQQAVRESGYRAAFTTNRGFRRFPIDRWALRRITMHATTSPLGIRIRCSGYYGLLRRVRRPW